MSCMSYGANFCKILDLLYALIHSLMLGIVFLLMWLTKIVLISFRHRCVVFLVRVSAFIDVFIDVSFFIWLCIHVFITAALRFLKHWFCDLNVSIWSSDGNFFSAIYSWKAVNASLFSSSSHRRLFVSPYGDAENNVYIKLFYLKKKLKNYVKPLR